MADTTAERHQSSLESRVSEKFSYNDADVTFESSNCVLFKLHRANLSSHSSIFPTGPEICSDGEVVKLEESSEVLELLFQHVYPGNVSAMDDAPFEILENVAEAAEKYQISVAMEICRLHMKNHAVTDALHVFKYACRHGYNTLADQIAPQLLDSELSSMLSAIGPVHFAQWVLYRESWIKLGGNMYPQSPHLVEGHQEGCHKRWQAAKPEWPMKLDPLRTPDAYFSPLIGITANVCSNCIKWWDERSTSFRIKLASIPTFSQITLPA